jgi:hypothetical protein
MSTSVQFVEASVFTRRLEKEAGRKSMQVLEAIQADLTEDADRWPLVAGTGSARKGRVGESGHGKSGSYRYLYLYFKRAGRIYLFYLFSKKEQGNLSAEQKKLVRRMIKAVSNELNLEGEGHAEE